ncbi:MAG: c-type cytochrome [Candidatus Rokubacteria bacterium]|nr:c-type cytochrome [Candidatus Rokubacteria bacterium]
MRAPTSGQPGGAGDESDRAVILAVLLSLVLAPSVGGVARAESEPPDKNPLSRDRTAIGEGRVWYRNVCGVCHGGRADGAGDRGQGADLRVFNKGLKKFVETVKAGRETGRAMKMPAWGGVLTDETIYQIGAYLETLAKNGANWGKPADH